ncbi:MAG: hypothetical protein ACTSRD_15285 [Promethearchaeota archaeon]
MVNLIIAIGVIIAMMVLVGNVVRVFVNKSIEQSNKPSERDNTKPILSS